MEAIIKFDMNEPDDIRSHLRCIKALDMACVLWEIRNMRKELEWIEEQGELTSEEVMTKILEQPQCKHRGVNVVMDGRDDMYNITIECFETKEVETNKVFLTIRDYQQIIKQINEVVYIDDDDKQWALKKIEKV